MTVNVLKLVVPRCRHKLSAILPVVIMGGLQAAGGTVCDVDGDGYPDLVFGSAAAGSEIWWWENPVSMA